MIHWYDEQLEPAGKPENIFISLKGVASIKYKKDGQKNIAILTTKLSVKITKQHDATLGRGIGGGDTKFFDGSEAVSVLWRTKETKLWNQEEASSLTESDVATKFQGWIDKFYRTTLRGGSVSFKLLVGKLALKAPKGVSTWILSLG